LFATKPTGTTFGEKHAWNGLLALCLLMGFFGIGDIIAGGTSLRGGESVLMHSISRISWDELQTTSPYVANLVDWQVRTRGAWIAGFAFLGAMICCTGFRLGERWSWYALWAIPARMAVTVIMLLTVDRAPGSGTPVPVFSGSILCLLAVLTLALSSRRFFQIAGHERVGGTVRA